MDLKKICLTIGIISLTSFVLIFFTSMILIFTMKKEKSINKTRRKQLVKAYKILEKICFILIGISMISINGWVCCFLYNILFLLVDAISGSIVFSEYISLTIILLSLEPTIVFMLKKIKKDCYEECGNKPMMQDVEIEGVKTKNVEIEIVSKIISMINKLPIKGIINIINLLLIIYANSTILLNIETGIATSSIYMTIATYYALDRVTDYMKKNFTSTWELIDNKIFSTEYIEKNVQFELSSLENLKTNLLDNYIETGKYEQQNQN